MLLRSDDSKGQHEMATLESYEWKYVGVDGCKAGWFWVGLNDDQDHGFGVAATFEELIDSLRNDALVLIDIPIGLPEGPGGRECDFGARGLLHNTDRKYSVFSAPTRQTAEQAKRDPKNRELAECKELKYARKGLSPFAFGIAPKIGEVDKVMLELRDRNDKPCVREVHPEVCFWALNGKRDMEYSKSTREGREDRLRVLRKHLGQAEEIYDQALAHHFRKDVACDDILDALAAALTALRGHGQFSKVPGSTASNGLPKDPKGLPIEMVYWVP